MHHSFCFTKIQIILSAFRRFKRDLNRSYGLRYDQNSFQNYFSFSVQYESIHNCMYRCMFTFSNNMCRCIMRMCRLIMHFRFCFLKSTIMYRHITSCIDSFLHKFTHVSTHAPFVSTHTEFTILFLKFNAVCIDTWPHVSIHNTLICPNTSFYNSELLFHEIIHTQAS